MCMLIFFLFAGCSVGLKISRGACKLTRTPRVIYIKKKNKERKRRRFNPTNYHIFAYYEKEVHPQDKSSTKAGGETEQKIVGNVYI